MNFLSVPQHSLIFLCFEVYDFSCMWFVWKTGYVDHSGACEIMQLLSSPKLLPFNQDTLHNLS